MRPMLSLAAAAILLAAPAAAQPVAAPVRIIYLHTYAYAPSPILLPAGRAVTLQFINRAGKRHDFTARRFFRSSRLLAGRVDNGEVDLRGGESRTVTLIPAAGRYQVHCGYPFHKMLGMRGTIVVQ